MAKKNQNPKYLLGVLDECITDKNIGEVTWSTNKIGGTANWIHANIPSPHCQVCSRELPLVVQIYCPLEGSPYHRCIYLFGCANVRCWNNSDSWVALRSQKLTDTTTVSLSSSEVSRRASVETWLENADDWGEEDNGNRLSDLESFHHSRVNNQSWTSVDIHQDIMDADGNNLINTETDDEDNRNVILSGDVHHLDALSNLDLNEGGGNGGVVEGAVGLDPNFEASAEIESPDDGTITIETPEQPSDDTIALLFSEPTPPPKDARFVIQPQFLAVVEESTSPHWTNQLKEHERELLARYQKRDGLNFNELFNRGRMDNSEIQSVGELYEKALPIHGDRVFYKFLSKLRLCPQQLLRYSRNIDSCPLFLAPPSADLLEPGKCDHCGDSRIFEFQLLPSAVDCLQVEDCEGAVIEFGVVVVYTCRASCWSDGDSIREERVLVQPDPDNACFSALARKRQL